MNKRRRRQQAQLNLLQSQIRLPGWNSLPEVCRDEVVALLGELLRQHAKTNARGAAHGGHDE
jgi:hypothetical protein